MNNLLYQVIELEILRLRYEKKKKNDKSLRLTTTVSLKFLNEIFTRMESFGGDGQPVVYMFRTDDDRMETYTIEDLIELLTRHFRLMSVKDLEKRLIQVRLTSSRRFFGIKVGELEYKNVMNPPLDKESSILYKYNKYLPAALKGFLWLTKENMINSSMNQPPISCDKMLWLYGKPGNGKSLLQQVILEVFTSRCVAVHHTVESFNKSLKNPSLSTDMKSKVITLLSDITHITPRESAILLDTISEGSKGLLESTDIHNIDLKLHSWIFATSNKRFSNFSSERDRYSRRIVEIVNTRSPKERDEDVHKKLQMEVLTLFNSATEEDYKNLLNWEEFIRPPVKTKADKGYYSGWSLDHIVEKLRAKYVYDPTLDDVNKMIPFDQFKESIESLGEKYRISDRRWVELLRKENGKDFSVIKREKVRYIPLVDKS